MNRQSIRPCNPNTVGNRLLARPTNYLFRMKPADLTISDTVLFLDLNLILTFACFAGTNILSGRILSKISASAAAGKLLVQTSIFVLAVVLNPGLYLRSGIDFTTSPIVTVIFPVLSSGS
jgi:hypothetical protein